MPAVAGGIDRRRTPGGESGGDDEHTLFNALNDWVDRYYRDRLTAADLADPQLLREGREALDVLSQLLNLGSVYPFQREGGGNG
ncbi:N-succinylarginine dihydrolase [Escherichia coli]|nr:N-succinylarginine dihydrolase [Escherichia coli]